MTKQSFANQLPRQVAPSKLDDVLDPFYSYVFQTFNCHRVGIIQSFDAETQLATVQLVDVLRKSTFQGQQTLVAPPIVNCPVFIPYGANGGLNFVVKEGLECLLLFNDRDLQNWRDTGASNTPATYRMHDFADALCLVGFKSIPKAIPNYDNTTVGITYLNDAGDEQAKVKCDEKVEIANQAQNLKDLIANLISILQNLKTVNGPSQYPIDPTTSSNLATLLTNFNALLK